MSAQRSFVGSSILVLALFLAGCESSPPAPSCTFAVNSTTRAFNSSGGQGSASVATAAACAWTAVANSPWVTFTGPASGTGPATLSFTVAANGGTVPRQAVLTIAGLSVAIDQEGQAPCEYAVSPSSVDLASTAGSITVNIAAGTGCDWTASSSVPWVTVTSSPTGSGSGSIALAVSANEQTTERQASVLVGGRSVSLRQAGASPTPPPPPPPVCEYAVSPVDLVQHWHLTSFTITISTTAGCSWSARPSEPWLSLDRTAGQGTGTIVVSHSALNEDSTRRAAVELRWPTPKEGQNVWVTQEGCRYGFEATASFTADGATRMVTVVTQPITSACRQECGPWTASSQVPWIRVTSSMPRFGDDAFFYQVDANTGGLRTGTIVVAGRTHTVTQAGR